jgi:hypothetical protein
MARSRSPTRGANATRKGKDSSTEKQFDKDRQAAARPSSRPAPSDPSSWLHSSLSISAAGDSRPILLPASGRLRRLLPCCHCPSCLMVPCQSNATKDSMVPERIQPCQFESAVDRRRCALRTLRAAPKSAPAISARTSRQSGSTSNAFLLARCLCSATLELTGLPRPASSSIASSPD